MSTPAKRTALEALKRPCLIELAKAQDLDVSSRAKHEEHVDAREALIFPGDVRRMYRAAMDPPDISATIAEVEELLDASIGPNGDLIREPKESRAMDSGLPYPADHRVDLSKIDFDALKVSFDRNNQPRATIAARQQTAKKKLYEVLRNDPTRRDLYEKLDEFLEDYHNAQESSGVIRKFIPGLSEEEARHVREGCSEEEVAIFDILTKPNLELTQKERNQVTGLAKDPLNNLKADKFSLGWRKKVRRRAAVKTTIQDVLDGLPEEDSDDLFVGKCDAVYEHAFQSYSGDGSSKYAGAPA